jgi:hypothetical protein
MKFVRNVKNLELESEDDNNSIIILFSVRSFVIDSTRDWK